jgi:hypothetical protein
MHMRAELTHARTPPLPTEVPPRTDPENERRRGSGLDCRHARRIARADSRHSPRLRALARAARREPFHVRRLERGQPLWQFRVWT